MWGAVNRVDLVSLAMVVGAWAMAIVMAVSNWRIIRQNQQLVSVAGQQMNDSMVQTQLMRSQFEVRMKSMERPKIIELVTKVINPVIYGLDYVIMTHFPRKLIVWGDVEGLLYDLERKQPGIKLIIENHNRDYAVLDSRIDGLKAMINTPQFKEKCRELIEKYDATVPPEKQLDGDINDRAEQFTYFVIQNRKDLGDTPEQSRTAGFWMIHGQELLKTREKEDIQKAVKEVESILDDYVGKARELREKVVQLREEWVTNFNLLRGEIGEEAL